MRRAIAEEYWMARAVPQQKIATRSGRRFSLRTLFIVSGVIAVPFLLLANLRGSVRPEETVASPLYLLLGVAGVVFAAAIGSAMAGRPGMFAAAGIAACCWIATAVLCSLFSKELKNVLPVHVLGALATLAVLGGIVWSTKKSEEDGHHDTLLKLLKVKHDVQQSQQAKHPDPPPADPIRNPQSEIRN
jgi:hypothetical protein